MTIIEAMKIILKNDLDDKKKDPTYIFNKDDLKRCYRNRCKETHPDENVAEDPENDVANLAGEEFKTVQQAYFQIKEELQKNGDNYQLLWNIYIEKKDSSIYQNQPEHSSYATSDLYKLSDEIERKIINIICANYVIKRIIRKSNPKFEFPDDEYLEDYLFSLKEPNPDDLEIVYEYLRNYMNELVERFNKEYGTNIYIGYNSVKYGITEMYNDFMKIWHAKKQHDKEFHNNATIDSIKQRLQKLFDCIKQYPTDNIILRWRIFELELLLSRNELKVGQALAITYELLVKLGLYPQTLEISKNNINMYKRYTSDDLPLVSKALSTWESYISSNELKVIGNTSDSPKGRKK